MTLDGSEHSSLVVADSKSVEFLRSENDSIRERISVLESTNQSLESGIKTLSTENDGLKIAIKQLMESKDKPSGSSIQDIVSKADIEQYRSFLKSQEGHRHEHQPQQTVVPNRSDYDPTGETKSATKANKRNRKNKPNKAKENSTRPTTAASTSDEPKKTMAPPQVEAPLDDGQTLRNGLRAAKSKDAVISLVEKAKQLNLIYEQQLGEKVLQNWEKNT